MDNDAGRSGNALSVNGRLRYTFRYGITAVESKNDGVNANSKPVADCLKRTA